MESKRLIKYLVITFSISWMCWWLLALLIWQRVMSFSHPIATIIFVIGGFGPTIAAILVSPEKTTLKSILHFVFAHRKNTGIYLLIFCLLLTATFGASSMEINPHLPLPVLPLLLVLMTFFGGGNEELGWRGIMQPILEKRLAFPIATLATGCTWAVWHFPLWFVNGSPQQNLHMPFILFSVYAVLASFWLAAVYKKTNCVFYCCVLHGLNNLLMTFFVLKINWILVIGLIVTLTLSIFVRYGNSPAFRN